MDVTAWMSERGHEQVVFVADPSVGLRAVIAIHSTALGPALGGVRFWHYDREDDAVLDVLRLSEAMSLKASVAGLDQGGGKAVVLWDDPRRVRRPELLRALGRAVHELGGRYLAAEDVGATTADMDGMATATPWVTGVSEAAGGSGDPSPITAIGVHQAMRAAATDRWGDASLRDRHVVVQGAGKVGTALSALLLKDGATVAVADVDDARVRELVRTVGVDAIPVSDAVSEPCDVLAPCALGPVVTPATIATLQCEIICGGANNPLESAEMDDELAARGIVYAPDFVANAGGILNLAEEPSGYSRERAVASTMRIGSTTTRVFAAARAWGVAPGRAAERLARTRMEQEAVPGGRWEPGDPTVWTELQSRRPG